MRRAVAPFTASMATNLASASRAAVSKRGFYVGEGGCDGIWGATMYRICLTIYGLVPVGIYFIWKVVFCHHSPKQQWIYGSTDLFEDDGTELEGEEAIANLRIQHERIMPFMNDYQEKIDAATA